MKSFTFLLIVLVGFLILHSILKTSTIEGLEEKTEGSCSPDKADLTYKNAATTEQQQTEIKNFQDDMKAQLKELEDKVNAFNAGIAINKVGIASNTALIKSSVGKVQDASAAKEKELDKLSV